MAENHVKASPANRQKKYPIRCIECGEKEVRPALIDHQVKVRHDGREYQLRLDALPVTKCNACGHLYFTQESDDAISLALREKLGLLTIDQIRTNLESLGLRQKDAAERLGIAAETLSRWLSGAMIQSRAMDNLLRGFFACPDLRDKLRGCRPDREFGVLHEESRSSLTSFEFEDDVKWKWPEKWQAEAPQQPAIGGGDQMACEEEECIAA